MGVFDDVQARARAAVAAGELVSRETSKRHTPPAAAQVRRPVRTNRFMSSETPLFGGLSPELAARLHEASRETQWAKKNLFIVEVTDLSPERESLTGGDGPGTFNFYAVDVGYAPYTLAGEKRRIGGAMQDGVVGNEPVELRITTLDDVSGTLKKWFERKASRVANQDGTVGLPAQYLVKVAVHHAFVVGASEGAYIDTMLMRPANIEYDLSRRDDAMTELQMTFTQADTFALP